jgi:hypothetical protein
MRAGLALVMLLGISAAPSARYGVDPEPKTYPQATPQEALASVVKAVQNKRIDYLLAHLADPEFVDRRVKENGGRFDLIVAEAQDKLVNDAGATKALQRFAQEGEWEAADERASVRLKDVSDRAVFLRKVNGQWFMENRRK